MRLLCECRGGLGGDGLATEKWLGAYVCKVCKKLDQIRSLKKPVDKSTKKTPRRTVTGEKYIYNHGNKWVVKKKVDGRTKYFGSFDTKKEALALRNKTML